MARSGYVPRYDDPTEQPWAPGDVGQNPNDDTDLEPIRRMFGVPSQWENWQRNHPPPVDEKNRKFAPPDPDDSPQAARKMGRHYASRTIGEIAEPYDDPQPVGSDEDLARARELMSGPKGRNSADEMAAKRIRERNRQDPSIPKYKALLNYLLPKIEANSPTEADYEENLRRTFDGLRKNGHDVGDVDAQIAELLMTYRKARTVVGTHAGDEDAPFEADPIQQNRRRELDDYQQDFRDRNK